MVVLTETWLNSTFFSEEYFNSTFVVYRTDRETTGSGFSLGGGTLIAVSEKLTSSALKIGGYDDIEYTAVTIRLDLNVRLIIYAAYIPPNSTSLIYGKHIAAIESIHMLQSDILLIMGDFNIPNVDWLPAEDAQFANNYLIPVNMSNQTAAPFLNEMMNMGLQQFNSVLNCMGRLLDLIFVSDSLNFDLTEPRPLSKIDLYHPPLLLTLDCCLSNAESALPSSRLNFVSGDYIGLANFLNDMNLADSLLGSLEEKVDSLHQILNLGISQFIPISNRRHFKNPWWNRSLQKLKNRKNKEWKRFRLTGDRLEFDRVFAEFDALNSVLHQKYVDRLKNSIKSSPASFWKHVRSKRGSNSLPKDLVFNSRSSNDINVQAEMFAEFFASNFNSDSSQSIASSDDLRSNSTTTASNGSFSLDPYFVFNELMRINVNSSAGPDGVHPLLLRNCASILYFPLACIFNESLASGVFPALWKTSSVSPIFKKGSRSDINNYRCIARLQTIAKFFEHCVNVKLLELVSSAISPRQHGFMKQRSTSSNLMEFVHYGLNGMNSCKQVDVLYTDFSKAFDRVNHAVLLRKLRTFGLPSNLVNWISSYLSNRNQFVKLGSAESRNFMVSSGVPQGSHLGPLLFLLFINDLPSIATDDTLISMFADDVRIAKTIRSPNDALILQATINRLKDWCSSNDLHLNLNKCAVLTLHKSRSWSRYLYTFGDHSFAVSDQQRDLGVLIDSKLSFVSHVDWIISKSTASLGFVKRFCRDIGDQDTIKAIYFALVQSHLDYCCPVWFAIPTNKADSIESVQRQFTMFALRQYPNANNNYLIDSYLMRMSSLNLVSLSRRRVNFCLLFLYDLINGLVNCPYVKTLVNLNTANVRNLRSPELFRITNSLARDYHAPITLICKMANKVKHLYIGCDCRSSFKRALFAIPDEMLM